jgi:fatty acid desaturase
VKLRKEIDERLSLDDFRHLQRVERWGRGFSLLGFGTGWLLPNPLSMAALSLGAFIRWMLMHHIGHKGYDAIPGVPDRYTSQRFARGTRRYLDWLDWMIPEAWLHEHNVLHHHHTGQERDPDLLERNLDGLRRSRLPMFVRVALVVLSALTWRFTYYAPVTLLELRAAQRRRFSRERAQYLASDAGERLDAKVFNPRSPAGAQLWRQSYLPYLALRFALPPCILWLSGFPSAAISMLINLLGAELLLNIHSFLVIVPNHAGEDLYRFDDAPQTKAQYHVRQTVASVNYNSTGPITDFLQGWLNYQIEHHIWPDLPMSQYPHVKPRVKEICRAHGVPYVEEPLWQRVRKMARIAVGQANMRRLRTNPVTDAQGTMDASEAA